MSAAAAMSVAKTAVAEATQAATRQSVRALRDARGVVNIPTRAIAAVLLKEGGPVRHEELYERSAEYGLFNSRRHFKHCLKMMKLQKRVQNICLGPSYPGSSRNAFSVTLTKRGQTVYTRYLGSDIPSPMDEDPPSLTNAT